jgi:hypothetical protein
MAAFVRFRYFRYNRAIEGAVRRHPKVRDRLQATVNDLVPVAKGNAPTLTGDYVDSIDGIVYMAADGLRGRLLARDWKAGLIEFGTVDTPAFHPLQMAAQASGLRWRAVKA